MAKNQNLIGLADERMKAGDINGTINAFSQFLRQSPSDPRVNAVRGRLGELYLSVGRLDEAERELSRALEHDPESQNFMYRLAQVHSYRGATDAAFDLLDRLLKKYPSDDRGLARRAALLQYIGRVEDAATVIDEAYAKGLDTVHLAHAFAGIAHSVNRRDEAIARLTPYADDRTQANKTRAEMNFTLARLYDRQGDFENAWARYETGNLLTKPLTDPDRLEASTDEIIATYTRAAIEKLERSDRSAERAVLIVGMPRSGTTLIEQILGAHPQAESGGELRALPAMAEQIPGTRIGLAYPPLNRVRGNALRRAAAGYHEALDGVSPTADRVTDKMPTNFRFLGLVPSLLPGARVIHCMRNPMDVCLSCYFRNFVGEHTFLTDLTWIGRYYQCYARLMRHWTVALNGLVKITDAPYESAVRELDGEARRLVSFIDLPFDDACLRFDQRRKMAPTLEPDQAGQHVYDSSIGRWRNYEKHLKPLIEALGPCFNSADA